jgi:2-polyprenyl-3-methyl-5-hydroxy-6-metoxy-1,4-benzoquinol methylase
MSERYKASTNVHNSKNTRLPIREEFYNCRFNRDALAHISRYLMICEQVISLSKMHGRPLTWLDIGCGDIYLARTLDKSFVVRKTDVVAEYVGFDIDDVKLKKVEATKPGSMDIALVCGDFTTGGLKQFSSNAFDVVTCLEVTEHVQSKFVLPLYQDIARICQFDGDIWISTPNFRGGTGKLPKDHIKEWNVEELLPLMAEAGLLVKSTTGIFSNLNHVKKYCEGNPWARTVFEALDPRFDSNFLSLVMGRLLGHEAQNILYHCRTTKQ